MKKAIVIIALSLVAGLSHGQTVDALYLNPKGDDGTPYRWTRFGNASAFWAGFMWNNNSPVYGNGNDFSIFTYGNRDITIRTGTGNFSVFPSSGGNMGIGTAAPVGKLQIINTTQNANGNTLILGPTNASNLRLGYNVNYSWIQSHGSKPLYVNEIGNNTIINLTRGNVGIGTPSPRNKLDVNGTVRAREIRVEASPWPDYVFAESYKLPSLEYTEEYISENGHLPEIPSAEEVAAEGIALGEMNAKLLRKIEELTLYVIRQNEKNKEQALAIGALQEENETLKSLSDRLQRIEKSLSEK